MDERVITRALGSTLTAFALWLAGCRGARAEEAPALPARAQVVLASCDRIVPRAALVERLRIELLSASIAEVEVLDSAASASEREDESEQGAVLEVSYPECSEASGLVSLRISTDSTGKQVERALIVGDVGIAARPRAVALAIVELLRASWLELASAELAGTSSPRPSTEDVVSSAQGAPLTEPLLDPEIEARRQKNRLEWLGGGRFYPAGSSGDLSTMVKLSTALSRRLRLHAGGIAASGGIAAGKDVDTFEAAGITGLGLSGGRDLELEVLGLLELGWSRAHGQDVKDVSGVFSIVSVQGTVRAAVARGLDAIVGLSAGYVLTPMDLESPSSQAGTLASISGPVIGVLIGLAGIL